MHRSARQKRRKFLFLATRDRKVNRRRQRLWESQSWPPAREHPVKVTSKQKRKRKDYRQSNLTIVFPAQFDLVQNPVEGVRFFDELRDAILNKPSRRININHETIQQVSPASGIVLIAELFRAHAYAPRCIKKGNLPRNPEVAELFEKIGYWKYFGVQYRGKTQSNRQFMIHKTGNKTIPTLVMEMILHFREAVRFTTSEEKSLYVALIECLDNVMNHAYPYRKVYRPPCLRHQWWVLAYRDSLTHEVCVCFYDQGVGIPQTIRRRADAQLLLIEDSDGDLVIKAVVEGHYSRHLRTTRGTGLPSLKYFIDEAKSGELVIVTDSVMCTFPHSGQPLSLVLPKPFPGTLIQWRMQR